eukprot:687902-Rhodomonas_salina.3
MARFPPAESNNSVSTDQRDQQMAAGRGQRARVIRSADRGRGKRKVLSTKELLKQAVQLCYAPKDFPRNLCLPNHRKAVWQ